MASWRPAGHALCCFVFGFGHFLRGCLARKVPIFSTRCSLGYFDKILQCAQFVRRWFVSPAMCRRHCSASLRIVIFRILTVSCGAWPCQYANFCAIRCNAQLPGLFIMHIYVFKKNSQAGGSTPAERATHPPWSKISRIYFAG
jgi:hypothetical protein